jgi:DNA-binding transcriptional MerR regulator
MSAPAREDAGRRLTIGAVCAALRLEHPDISISKIRYLEDQGLLTPKRTQGGYRLFSQEDVDRLRTILRLQRDEFLPLRVIRDELERVTQGARERPSTRRRSASAKVGRGPTLEELTSTTGAEPEFVRSLEEFGLLAAIDGRYQPEDSQIVETCAQLARFGLGARHLRAVHSSILREAGLIEQILSPSLRSGNPDRVNAGLDNLRELSSLCGSLTETTLNRDLRRIAGATTTAPRAAANGDPA